jgi:hypothetical protein
MTLYRLFLYLAFPGYCRVMRINARRVMERRAAGARR